jgi:bacterioferritin
MLAQDMRDEHAAIVQYLQHAYALGETGEASEIEGIARDEMRHFDWLAEAIVELGGDPDMVRGAVDLEGSGADDWMARDIQAEERAIAQYKEHIAAIDDPKIVRLLERILSDERAHRDQFASLAQDLSAEGSGEAGPLESREAEGVPPRDISILQEGVQHEYSVIVQYLYHTFVLPQCEVSRELEMQAINEMQHLGWLAEEVAERNGHPLIEVGDVTLQGSPEDMLKADIAAERAVTEVYSEQIEQVSEDELRELIARIREHEVYHESVFGDLLAEISAAVDAGGQLTVGSLIDKRET